MDERSYVDGAISEGAFADGTFRCDGARIADRLGEHRLPIGVDSFERLIERSVFVDKSLLIADVLDSGAAVTLYCRPRRFGKTLGLSMLKSFIENPVDGVSRAPLFENLAIWDARSGRYRVFQGGYPVVFLSFNDVKKPSWQEAYKVIAQKISYEYQRHSYLLDSPALNRFERAQFARACAGEADYGEIATSLLALMRYLHKHHGAPVAVLVDEYDVPIVAGHAGGYYDEAVAFLKGLLTGAFKGSDDLAFGCLTGVQRIAKESIFTDLNNLTVSTALSTDSDERFGFTHADVEALARYLGHAEKVPEIRSWYDGYRFGDADIFNPWSVLNYFRSGCTPDVYWVNTSGNTVVGEAVASADARRLGQLFDLLKPGGSVTAPLDLGVVFPEVGGGADAVWSLLYLAGYLTTYDTQAPNNARVERRLRIPNREIAELFRGEVVDRFSHEAGGGERLRELQQALAEGDGRALAACIEAVLVDAASCRDLTSENSYCSASQATRTRFPTEREAGGTSTSFSGRCRASGPTSCSSSNTSVAQRSSAATRGCRKHWKTVPSRLLSRLPLTTTAVTRAKSPTRGHDRSPSATASPLEAAMWQWRRPRAAERATRPRPSLRRREGRHAAGTHGTAALAACRLRHNCGVSFGRVLLSSMSFRGCVRARVRRLVARIARL